jgi:hypothetical protein
LKHEIASSNMGFSRVAATDVTFMPDRQGWESSAITRRESAAHAKKRHHKLTCGCQATRKIVDLKACDENRAERRCEMIMINIE